MTVVGVQLGFEFSNDLAVKIHWLTPAVRALDMSAPVIAAHCHGVLSQLHEHVRERFGSLESSSPLYQDTLKLLMSVADKQQGSQF